MIHRLASRALAGLSLATALGLGGHAAAAQAAAPAGPGKAMACEPLLAFVGSTPPTDSREAVFFWPADEVEDGIYMYAVLAASPSTPDEARTLLWDGYAQTTHYVTLERMARILGDCLSTPAGRKLTAARPASVDVDCAGEPSVRARGPCLRVRVGPQR